MSFIPPHFFISFLFILMKHMLQFRLQYGVSLNEANSGIWLTTAFAIKRFSSLLGSSNIFISNVFSCIPVEENSFYSVFLVFSINSFFFILVDMNSFRN